MLVNMRDLLADAEKGNYAVGSFSVANMEMVLGAVQAAEELNAPIILQIAEVRLKQSPLEMLPFTSTMAKRLKKSIKRLKSDLLPLCLTARIFRSTKISR